MNPEALLETEGLTLRVGARVLLANLRLRVEAGQCWALLGRNGAGKSTLLRALAGLDRADAPVRLDGTPLDRLTPRELARRRAFLPGQPGDRFGIEVLHAVMLAQRAPDADAALAWLRRFDCDALASRHVLQLSAGERQRVALAQTLAQDTPLLLLDEPVSFQDPAHQGLVARALAELPGRALVFVAHDVNWVARLATHVLAFEPDGAWSAGPVGQLLDGATLQRVYGCAWQRVERGDAAEPDLWVAAG